MRSILLAVMLLVHTVSHAQSNSNLKYAKVKLEMDGFDFATVPKVLWIDGQSNTIVRFGLGVNETNGEVDTISMDSITASDKQWIMCDSVVRAMPNLKLNGTKPNIKEFSARGTITFSNPNPIPEAAAQKIAVTDEQSEINDMDGVSNSVPHPTPTIKRKVSVGKIYRYPITIASPPFKETGLPYSEYRSNYIAYIDKFGTAMKIDSAGDADASMGKRYSAGIYHTTYTGHLVNYRTESEVDSLFSNYSADFNPSYRTKSQTVLVQLPRGIRHKNSWLLYDKSGKIVTSNAICPCVTPDRDNQTSYIRYVGNNRYWAVCNCYEAKASFLLNENGKILLSLYGPSACEVQERYIGGRLALRNGTVIDLNGVKLFGNSDYDIRHVVDADVVQAVVHPLTPQAKWCYVNIRTKKIIYTDGDYEKSGRTYPIVK